MLALGQQTHLLFIKMVEGAGDLQLDEAGPLVLDHDAEVPVLVANGEPHHHVQVELVETPHLDAVVHAARV